MFLKIDQYPASLNARLGKFLYSELQSAAMIGPPGCIIVHDRDDVLFTLEAVVIADFRLAIAVSIKGPAVMRETVPLRGVLQINNCHIVGGDVIDPRGYARHTEVHERDLPATDRIG